MTTTPHTPDLPEMPRPDCEGTSPTHDPDNGDYYEWRGWHVGPDGLTLIERYAQQQRERAEKAEARIEELEGVVERLPKFADGSSLVIDDPTPLFDGTYCICHPVYGKAGLVEYDGICWYASFPLTKGYASIPITECYPNEAALARKDTTND